MDVVRYYWKAIVFCLTPLVWLPVPLLWHPTEGAAVSRVAYVILIMATYWVTEVIPLAVTALIPLVAFPILIVTSAKAVAVQYLSDGTWLFTGGLIVAVAVEEVNLHRRIALNILNITGSVPGRLMFGVQISAALLSMFISNTATTAMMMPVVLSLAAEIVRARRRLQRVAPLTASVAHNAVAPVRHIGSADGGHTNVAAVIPMNELAPSSTTVVNGPYVDGVNSTPPTETDALTNEQLMTTEMLSKSELCMTKALLLATCYAASLGGTATLTGTLPNIIMKSLLDQDYGTDHPINYATWFAYNGPGCCINLVTSCAWLQLFFFGPSEIVRTFRGQAPNDTGAQNVHRILAEELKKLGRITFAEVSLLCWYGTALFLWLTRELVGWGLWWFTVDKVKYVSDTTCIMAIVLMLFIWPMRLTAGGGDGNGRTYQPLLTWHAVEKKFPWGVIMLLGGGYAIAGAAKSSGLSSMIALKLAALQLSTFWMVVISLLLMTYLTEFTSNTGTSQVVLPITMALAEKRCINPLYLTMPVSEAASFAYMLPVATPPNAIVFSSGLLRVTDMIMAGFVMNFLCMFEVLLSIHAWGWLMFRLDEYPDWGLNVARCHNLTTTDLFANDTLTTLLL